MTTITSEIAEWREMLNAAKLYNSHSEDARNALRVAEYAIDAKLAHHVKVHIEQNNIYLDITIHQDGAIAHVVFADDRIYWSWDVVSPKTYQTEFVDARGVISCIKDTIPNVLKVLPISPSWSVDHNDIDSLLGFDAEDSTTDAVQSGSDYSGSNIWYPTRVRPIFEFVDYISYDQRITGLYLDTSSGPVFDQVSFSFADGFICWTASLSFHDKNLVEFEVDRYSHGKRVGSHKYRNPKDLFNRLG